jgi:hypothetical protein
VARPLSLKAAVVSAVALGCTVAGPAVANASAATTTPKVAPAAVIAQDLSRAGVSPLLIPALRAKVESLEAHDTTSPTPDTLLDQVTEVIQRYLEPDQLEMLLWDLPGFGPY